jgi:hypothetical protein
MRSYNLIWKCICNMAFFCSLGFASQDSSQIPSTNASPDSIKSDSSAQKDAVIRIDEWEFYVTPPSGTYIYLDDFNIWTRKTGCSAFSTSTSTKMDAAYIEMLLGNNKDTLATVLQQNTRNISAKAFLIQNAQVTESSSMYIAPTTRSPFGGVPVAAPRYCTDIHTGASLVLMSTWSYTVSRISRIDLVAIRLAYGSPSNGAGTGEEAMWNLVKDTSDKKQIQQYLDKYPQGQFSAIAGETLNLLKEAKQPLTLYIFHSNKDLKKKKISVDKAEIASIERGQFFGIRLAPGDHDISSGDGISKISAGTEQTYFASISPEGLLFVDKETAMKQLKTLQPIQSKNAKNSEALILALPGFDQR